MRRHLLSTLTTLALAVAPLAIAESPYPVTELFPVEPGINAERGFAVAVDGDWLAMGALRDDEAQKDAGAVYLFHWSGTTWDQEGKLFANPPRENAQLGLTLAMRGGVLAAGAPGEGAVYLFIRQDGAWIQEKRLAATGHGAGTFGRSLALDGNRLAVGAFDPHGATEGVVYLYGGDSWDFEQVIRPHARQRGERFGTAVSLAGNVLAVGAPGHDSPRADDAGVVYVFERGAVRWREKAKLLAQAGQQLGFAVATGGTRIFAGAPTAAPGNAGAVFRFEKEDGAWTPQGLLEVEEPRSGDQLGTSLALSGDLLAAGAPAPPPGTGTGRVHLFRRGDSWEERGFLVPDNSEIRDLTGFAVAADGERVVVGGVLGDEGNAAAGAAWSFHCPTGEACVEEAEAVARDPRSRTFGVSVALTKDALAVGAHDGAETPRGLVYLYRPARDGWRQVQRLASFFPGDGFGSSVALEGDLLAVGAPQPRFSQVSPPFDFPDGSVDLFVRRGSSWVFEALLAPPEGPVQALAFETGAFGTSVAIAGGVVAVGAPGHSAVYLFEKGDRGWAPVRTLIAFVEGFGSAISLRGGVLAIGAPGADDGTGAVYVSVRGDRGWTEPLLLPPDRTLLPSAAGLALGTSVAIGDGILAVGAPGFKDGQGAVLLFEGTDTSWSLISSRAPRRFGSSVALLGNRLVVGGPGEDGTDPDDLDRVAVFERRSGDWVLVADLDALQPPHGDAFGTAVALSEDFFVVTSPGPPRGDRVTVFALPPPEGGNP